MDMPWSVSSRVWKVSFFLLLCSRLEKDAQIAMRLFEGLDDPFQVWMSHGDKLSALPSGFFDIGATSNAEHAAIASHDKVMYGIQFHPEVTHTPQGRILLKNFVLNICQARADWEMG